MGLTFVSEPVRVRTPATSANLGPGFDTLGLALTLYDDLTARVTGTSFTVAVTGEGAGELPDDESHLVVRAMLATFDELGERPAGVAVECHNRIPQARGLGSSSAAIVGGVQLARALVREQISDEDALRIAARLEGHPDNVAPCLLGGFTIAWSEADGSRAVKLAVAEGVQATIFVPQERGLTATARAALPSSVPHGDAAFNTGRAALLVHAIQHDPALLFAATEDRLHQGYRAEAMPGTASLVAALLVHAVQHEPALLFTATEDRLHQGYRAEAMPGTASLVAALRSVGVAAVVSGAGPTVLALSPVPGDFRPGSAWRVESLGVDGTGALVKGGMLKHAERGPVAAGRKS
jgi:homoserine kinase